MRFRRSVFGLRTAAGLSVRRYVAGESQHLFALTLVVGVVCGFVAVAFHLTIRAAEHVLIERALHAPSPDWMGWTIATPCLGGLAAGMLLTWLVPGARGSGIPQVKQAFAVEGGRVRFRDAVGKFFIAALQIGSGASLGREGPTVQICSGAASLLARATSLARHNMRRLTPVGVAAGIAAAFNAPIAAVTFTIEEIVGTLDQAILSGVVVAAALAAVIERGILGVHPVIEVAERYGLEHASSLGFYALLGVLAACVSVAFTESLLKLRAWFRAWKGMPIWAQPAIGGLVTGVLAVLCIRFVRVGGITSGGYETLGLALAGHLSVRALVVLCVAKLLATVFSYSSGGAGGIFAPSLFIGAMLGGAVGQLDVVLLGHETSQLGAFALVGMGAVFAGIIRAPITSVLIIFEMTGGYGLVLPLMLANTTAYMLARKLRPTPIYEALLEQDGIVLPRVSTPAMRAHTLVSAKRTTSEPPRPQLPETAATLMLPLSTVSAAASVSELSDLLRDSSSQLLVVRRDEREFGVIAKAYLREGDLAQGLCAADVARPAPNVAASAELPALAEALASSGVDAAVVVDATTPIGVITKSAVVRALIESYARRSKPVSAAPARASVV